MHMHYVAGAKRMGAMAKTNAILEVPATITERGQTTVPTAIRRMLGLEKRDHVVFRGLPDGTVTIVRRERSEAEGDPVIAAFLDFLAGDMARDPSSIRGVPLKLVEQARTLVDGVDVDLTEPLPDDDA